jgi:hypothetical protein
MRLNENGVMKAILKAGAINGYLVKTVSQLMKANVSINGAASGWRNG